MHDMSNTRKEIAARLGFAAGNGAKASFGRAEDVYRLLETTPSSYNNAKKLDALATEAMRLADITPAGKNVSLHELAEMVGQDLEGDRSRASRPGAKVAFAAHPSWSEGILGKDTDPKLAAYSWISKNNIESGRKQMLLADLAAGMYEKNPSMSIAQAVLAAAKDMVSKGVATRDIQQWAENGGKFARPGAKAEFAIDARDELMMRTWIKNNYPKADNAAFAKMLAKMTKEYAKDPKGYTYGGGFRAVAKAAGFSRDGAKAKMALTISTVGAKNACYEALSNLKALAQLASETNSGWDFHVTVMIDHVKSAMSQLESSPAQAGEYLSRAIDTLGMLRKIDPVRLNDIQKGSLKQLIGYVAKSLRDARANIKVVTTAARPGAKTRMTREQSEEQKAGLKLMSAADPAVGAKIATLIKEGKPQDQAVAIALDMKRRGEL
jgi:hypothetical protein